MQRTAPHERHPGAQSSATVVAPEPTLHGLGSSARIHSDPTIARSSHAKHQHRPSHSRSRRRFAADPRRIIQAIDPGDTIPTLRPVEHLVLALYATCLLLLVPAYRGLAAYAGGRRSAHAAVAGMVS
jgi:hypothetical protein